jgi:hypothetical protein
MEPSVGRGAAATARTDLCILRRGTMSKRISVRSPLWGVLVVLCMVGCGTTAVVDSEARDVLRGLSRTLADAQAFSFTAQETTEGMAPGGGYARVVRDRTVAVKRPDRLRFDVVGDDVNLKLYYDGRALTAVGGDAYAVEDLPGTVDTALDFAMAEYQIKLVFSELIHGDPYAALAEWADTIEYLGTEDVNGRQLHHIALAGQQGVADLWLESEGDPLPVKATVRNTVLLGAPSNTIVFSDWDLEADLPDEMFTYVPPAGSTDIDLTDLLLKR